MKINAREIRYFVLKQDKSVRYEGLTVPIDQSIVPEAVVKQLLRNKYEKPEINALKALVRPDDRVLELGSGIGVVSTLVAKTATAGAVLTFDANPNLQEQIRSVHEANGIGNAERRVGLVRAAPDDATATFHLHASFAESSVRKSDGTTASITVPVWVWSEVIAEFKPTVLVCDIEGGEAELLPAIDYEGLRAVIVELHPGMVSQKEIAAIFERLLGAGFAPRIDLVSGTVVAFEALA